MVLLNYFDFQEDAGMEVAHYRVQQDSDNLDSDQVSVVMETPPSSKNIFRKFYFIMYQLIFIYDELYALM